MSGPTPNPEPLHVRFGVRPTVAEGLGPDAPGMHDAVVRAAFALLTPEQLAEVVANRVVIEQAKGMLMMIYDVDGDEAFDLLRWRSQETNVKVRILAGQLITEFRSLIDHYCSPPREAYDHVLLTAHACLPGA